MGSSDEDGAGYPTPTPVDYDIEEDRERNGWEWEGPRDVSEVNESCDLSEESLQAESCGDAKTTYLDRRARANQSDGAAVIVDGYRPFSLENNSPVLVQAVPSRGLSFQLWPAAEALCHYLESAYGTISGPLRGLRVLELGAGTGLVGIFAARLGADVILTDLPGVLNNLRANVALNRGRGRGVAGIPAVPDNPAVSGNPITVMEKHGVNRNSAAKRDLVAKEDTARFGERFVHDNRDRAEEGGVANCLRRAEAAVNPCEIEMGFEGELRREQECTGSRTGLTGRELRAEMKGGSREEEGIAGTDPFGFEAKIGLTNDGGKTSPLWSESSTNAEPVGSVSVEPLSWGVKEDVDALVTRKGAFDLILASDVVYYDTLFEPLLQSLRWLTGQGVVKLPRACSGNPQSPSQKRSGNSASIPFEKVSEGKTAGGTSARASESLGEKQTVLIAHLRRWKKDAKFFRKASKYFDIRLVYSHPPVDEARKGVEVFELIAKK